MRKQNRPVSTVLLPPDPQHLPGPTERDLKQIYQWGTAIEKDVQALKVPRPVTTAIKSALAGNGTLNSPLAVRPDNRTIITNGNNELEARVGSSGSGEVDVSATGALDGDGSTLSPLAVRVDGVTVTINGANRLVSTGGSGISQLTGDVTAGPGSGSQAATIANDAVTYAKMQNASAGNVFLARADNSAGNYSELAIGISQLAGRGASGNVTAITLGAGLTMTGTTISTTGSSGGATSSTAVGSEPGSPTAGDLDFYTNGFGIARYSGSAWPLWAPVFATTAPVDGDFAWINQGGASVSTTNGGIVLTAPINSGISLRIRKKAAPATPYTITAGFIASLLNFTSQACGLCFRESGTGEVVTFMIQGVTAGQTLGVHKYTSPTAFSATYSSRSWFPCVPMIWLQISDDGVNRIARYSTNGRTFIQFHSVGRTDFLTADEVGFFSDEETNTYDTAMTLLSWAES